MSKLKQILIIMGAVSLAYLLLTVTMPVLSTFANDSANIVATNANVVAGKYPGAEEGPRMAPLVLWFIPAVSGIVGIVIVLKRGEGE